MATAQPSSLSPPSAFGVRARLLPRSKDHITMWLDKPGCRAAGYVMLSRVSFDGDYLIAGPVCRNSFTPAM